MSLTIRSPRASPPVILVICQSYREYIIWCHEHYLDPNGKICKYIPTYGTLLGFDPRNSRLLFQHHERRTYRTSLVASLRYYQTKERIYRSELCLIYKDMFLKHAVNHSKALAGLW